MTCIKFRNGIMCVGRIGTLVDANGKTWTFEVDPFLGMPYVLNKDGSVRARQPGERSPFWAAFAALDS